MRWFVVSRRIHDGLRCAPMAVGTADVTRPSALLRVVLVVHGIITLAGASVLTIFPTAIPLTVGISLQPDDYLIVYLVAAAELAVAVLVAAWRADGSGQRRRRRPPAAENSTLS